MGDGYSGRDLGGTEGSVEGVSHCDIYGLDIPVASPDVRSQARNQRDTFPKKYLLGTNLTLFIAIG